MRTEDKLDLVKSTMDTLEKTKEFVKYSDDPDKYRELRRIDEELERLYLLRKNLSFKLVFS